MERFIAISGCSGGGKSTLLAELKERGYAVVEEPGRRIIAEEVGGGGHALPWVDPVAFAQRAIEMSLRDREQAASTSGPVFFDRGLIDAAAALEHASGLPALRTFCEHRYNHCVYITPPWPEIYASDGERRHSMLEAVAEYERLLNAFTSLGYEIEVLPKVTVAERANFILGHLQFDKQH